MAQTIARLAAQVVIEGNQAKRGLQGIRKDLTSTQASMGKFQTAASGLNTALGALGLVGIGSQVLSFGKASLDAALQVEKLGTANKNLAAEIGTTSQALVSGIQAAAGGTISQLAALEASNKALAFGIVENQGEMEELTRIAVTLGAAMGQDATKSLDDLTVALSRNSPLILDNLGITLKLEDAYRIYAASIGKTAEALTEEEKSLAFRNAALIKGRELVETLGDVTNTQAASAERAGAAWADFTSSFGGLLASTEQSLGVFEKATAGINALTQGAQAWQGVIANVGTIREYNRETLGAASGNEAFENTFVELANSTKAFIPPVTAAELAMIDTQTAGRNTTVAIEEQAAAVTEATAVWQQFAGVSNNAAQQAQAAQFAVEQANAARLAETGAAGALTNAQFAASQFASGNIGGGMQQAASFSELKNLRSEMEQAGKDAAKGLSSGLTSALESAFSDLKSMVSNVVQPSLDEIWQPPSDDTRFDEDARRLATVATSGFSSEWLAGLEAQFAGQDFFAPILDAMQAGDEGALKAAASEILQNNVSALWDPEIVKAQVREQVQQTNLREEFLNAITEQLAAEEGLMIPPEKNPINSLFSGMMGGGMAGGEGEGGAGGMMGGFQEAIAPMLENFQAILPEAIGLTSEAHTAMMELATEEWTLLNENYMMLAGETFPAVSASHTTALTTILAKLTELAGQTTSHTATMAAGHDTVRRAIESQEQPIRRAIQALDDYVGKGKEAISVLQSLRGTSAGKKLGEKVAESASGQIFARAEGGPVSTGGTYLVGERGPELFSPGRNGFISPNSSLGGSFSQSINVVVNNPANARQIVDQLEQELRARGKQFARVR